MQVLSTSLIGKHELQYIKLHKCKQEANKCVMIRIEVFINVLYVTKKENTQKSPKEIYYIENLF